MSNQFNRRTIITMLGGAVVGHTSAWGHDLRPDDPSYRFEEYEAIVNRRAHVRQVYEWATIANSLIFANIRNGLNRFQFSYDVPPREVQIVVQAYSSANAANYDDFIWEKYRMGEALAVRDPQTNQPATRNIFFGSPVTDTTLTPGRQPAERNDPFFDDTSMEGLQRRRVLFLACHQSTHALSNAASTSGRNPDQKSVEEIVAEFRQHYLPGVIETPAGVGELVRLQNKGYRLVVNN
jgi:intracellular sulfur oxidation DsrE/DsrF family protein